MRRIRNTTEDALQVPILGVTLEPGDVANVPDELDHVEFSEAFFEVDGDTRERDSESADNVTEIFASDEGSSDEGVNE